MTQSGPIEAYQVAFRAYKATEQQADRMASHVVEAGRALQNWRTVMFANLNVGFPAEIALSSRSPSIDGKNWPNVQTLAETIARYHQEKHELDNAWRRIPESDRIGLQAPPR